MKIVISLLLLGALVKPALAVEQYEKTSEILAAYDKGSQRDRDLLEGYASGLGDGMGYANVALAERKDKMLYCQPKRLALRGSQIVGMVKSGVEEHPALGGVPMFASIAYVLMHTFPCDEK